MSLITNILNPIRSSWALVREHKRSYIIFNILYYGLILIFMGVTAMNRSLQNALDRSAHESLAGGSLAMVSEAYAHAEVLKAIALTFVINLFFGSVAIITFPSMIVPFSGLLVGVFRAILWGVLFSPGHPDKQHIDVPHSLTMIIEGQAYVLVMLAAGLHGRAFLFPKSAGVIGHWHGYVEGFKQTGRIYFLVVPILLVAAVYEAIEVIWMVQIKGV
ncbi:MAG: hypothetical protein HY286_12440 [Planctomycetes bacterium]|nr:hypothetical protein [Planctomycetota bacterium]